MWYAIARYLLEKGKEYKQENQYLKSNFQRPRSQFTKSLVRARKGQKQERNEFKGKYILIATYTMADEKKVTKIRCLILLNQTIHKI